MTTKHPKKTPHTILTLSAQPALDSQDTETPEDIESARNLEDWTAITAAQIDGARLNWTEAELRLGWGDR